VALICGGGILEIINFGPRVHSMRCSATVKYT
jgi:hypothetical protein